jgi:hypothetical protein
MNGEEDVSEPPVRPPPLPERLSARLQQLNESANGGNESAQAELRALLDEHRKV